MFTEFDKTVKEIICGKHREMCCLLPIIDKAEDWLDTFGKEGTIQLLELLCTCAAPQPTPPPTPNPPVVTPPTPNPTIPVTYEQPNPTPTTKCAEDIPPKGQVA